MLFALLCVRLILPMSGGGKNLVAVEGTWTYDLLILAVRVSVEGQGTNDRRFVCMISGHECRGKNSWSMKGNLDQ